MIKDIAKVDPNFSASNELNLTDAVFYDVKENSFCLYGVFYKDGFYRRMPEKVAKSVSDGVHILHTHTSGGRLRFMTDSPYVAISAKTPMGSEARYMPPTGARGFDLYADGKYIQVFTPPVPLKEDYDSVRNLPDGGLHEVTVHFPLYFDVKELRLGLKQNAKFLPIPEKNVGKKVLFYGSSITQGGCVSRPGMAYPNILANKYGFDVVNLGFSGNAKGEDAMCDYIIAQNPDVFVYDYDHNAPSIAHLNDTHERFFLRFREAHPDTPIIILSSPDVIFKGGPFRRRRDVIKKTYENAIARGDENVFFLDGETLFGNEDADLCTVDACHPNDLGHYRMAMKIAPVLKKLL